MSLGRARLIVCLGTENTWLGSRQPCSCSGHLTEAGRVGRRDRVVERQNPGCQWVIDLVNPLEALSLYEPVQICYSIYIFRQSQVHPI